MFDCGMMCFAKNTIQKIKNALKGRPLDYLFLSHTHYDHIGALPFIRTEWPQVRVVTSGTGAAVLLKDTPRRVIRELSAVAANHYGLDFDINYDDGDFKADITVKDGDVISLGGFSVRVLETPGHTRDSLSYFIPEAELLILSETTGVLMPDGSVYTCYLTGFKDTLDSIEKCRRIQCEFLSLPHRGFIGRKEAKGFFDKALDSVNDWHETILNMNRKGYNEDEMLDSLYRKYNNNEMLASYQPNEAFFANAKAIIACTLRENL
jgi:glyoxylase-like metal-dependent hydrolase (beta-lactamase superfamily II)